MHSFKKVLMGIGALAAFGLGGAAIAGAAGGNGAGKAEDGPDAALTSPAAEQAGAAASEALGGGRVVSVERSDEGGSAVYEVKVDKSATLSEVQVAMDGSVLSQKADDDQESNRGDGDGETAGG